jgi:hypothetical protein
VLTVIENLSTIDKYCICCGCLQDVFDEWKTRFRVPLGGKCRSGVDYVNYIPSAAKKPTIKPNQSGGSDRLVPKFQGYVDAMTPEHRSLQLTVPGTLSIQRIEDVSQACSFHLLQSCKLVDGKWQPSCKFRNGFAYIGFFVVCGRPTTPTISKANSCPGSRDSGRILKKPSALASVIAVISSHGKQ